MKIKWKCVWKVLKPKVIAALIIILSAIVGIAVMFLLVNYWMSTIKPIDFNNMTVAQRQEMIATSGCGGCGFSLSSIVLFLMVIFGGIGIIYLSIELIKSLAEALKPCIIWEEK